MASELGANIDLNVSVRASWEELRELSPKQCKAFMAGVAEILSASRDENDERQASDAN